MYGIAEFLWGAVLGKRSAAWLFQGRVKSFAQPFRINQTLTAQGLIGAFFAAPFTYDGW